MKRKQDHDMVKYFWFINGLDKLIVSLWIIVVVGAGAYGLTRETFGTFEIVLMELGVLIICVSFMALVFYSSYNSYLTFIGGKKFSVTGGDNFLKSFSESFWNDKSTASISFTVEVAKEEGPEIRKAITDFLSNFVKVGNERFISNFKIKLWTVTGEIRMGKQSNYLLGKLMLNLNDIRERFPASNFSLLLNTSGETIIESTAVESTDETWTEARYRYLDEQKWHDDDLGGSHPHH